MLYLKIILLLINIKAIEFKLNIDYNNQKKLIETKLFKQNYLIKKNIENIYEFSKYNLDKIKNEKYCLKINNICKLKKCSLKEWYYFIKTEYLLNCENKIKEDKFLKSMVDDSKNLIKFYYRTKILLLKNKQEWLNSGSCYMIWEYFDKKNNIFKNNIKSKILDYSYTKFAVDILKDCTENNIINDKSTIFIRNLVNKNSLNQNSYIFNSGINSYGTSLSILNNIFEINKQLKIPNLENIIYKHSNDFFNYLNEYTIMNYKELNYFEKFKNIIKDNVQFFEFTNKIDLKNCSSDHCNLDYKFVDIFNKKLNINFKLKLKIYFKDFSTKIIESNNNKFPLPLKDVFLYKIELINKPNNIYQLKTLLQVSDNYFIKDLSLQINNYNIANDLKLINDKECENLNLVATEKSFIHIKFNLNKNIETNFFFVKLINKNIQFTKSWKLKLESGFYSGFLDLGDPDIITAVDGIYDLEISSYDGKFLKPIYKICKNIKISFKSSKSHYYNENQYIPKKIVLFVKKVKIEKIKPFYPILFMVMFSVVFIFYFKKVILVELNLNLKNQKLSAFVLNLIYVFIMFVMFLLIILLGVSRILIDYFLIVVMWILFSFIIGNKASKSIKIVEKVKTE